LSDRDQLLGERFDHAGDAVVDLGQRGCQPMPLAGGWFGGACAAQPSVDLGADQDRSVPYKLPGDGNVLAVDHLAYNALQSGQRALRERGFALLTKRWPPSFTGLTTRRAWSWDRRGEVHLSSQNAISEDRKLVWKVHLFRAT